ncbi:MAG: hypothetical protein PWP21_1309, partial [Thermosediminibacterales bacterium]|nr:hypothetical protein [Thermosediminibacterales bacterium]
FKITSSNGINILVDPYIVNNKACSKDIKDVNDIDLLLITHGAFDHFEDAFEIIMKNRPTVISDFAIKEYLIQKGVPEDDIISAVWGFNIDFKGIRIRVVQSNHVNSVKYDGGYITGIPLGFIVYDESDKSIYIPGDTSISPHIKLLGELYEPDVCLMHIGSAPGFYSELTPYEAALATKWLKSKVVIPMHYQPEEEKELALFSKNMKKLAPNIKIEKLLPGETLNY